MFDNCLICKHSKAICFLRFFSGLFRYARNDIISRLEVQWIYVGTKYTKISGLFSFLGRPFLRIIDMHPASVTGCLRKILQPLKRL